MLASTNLFSLLSLVDSRGFRASISHACGKWLPLSAIQSTRVWMCRTVIPYNGFTRTATFAV
jgi:hypothetical protein